MNTKLNIEHTVNNNDLVEAKQILIADLTNRFGCEGIMMWETLYGVFPSYRTVQANQDYNKLMKEKYAVVYDACERRLER